MEISPQVQARLDQLAKLPAMARGALLGLVAVVMGAGYFFLMYEDARDDHQRLQVKELELQRKLSEVRSIAANIDEFEIEIANLEIKLQTVLQQLPNEREIEVLLTDISSLGKKAGIEIKEFRRMKEVSRGFYAEVPIDLELTGEYHDIARFFDLLAGLRRIVNMGSINVSVGSDTMEATVLRAKGTATTFRFIGKGESV